jgi:CheY-like chemotaxis protein
MRVLIADDHPINRAVLTRQLAKLDLQTVAVDDGAAAAAAARAEGFDWILLDVEMPNLDGLDAALQIRDAGASRDARIALLTGFGADELGPRVQQAAITRVLGKPVTLQALRDLFAGEPAGPPRVEPAPASQAASQPATPQPADPAVSAQGRQTEFADPDRAEPDELARQAGVVGRQTLLFDALDALVDPAVVLNSRRQIVGASASALRALGIEADRHIIGHRPGEALGCEVVAAACEGCGTGDACSTCGAVLAVLGAEKDGVRTERECSIRLANGDACEFRVVAKPIRIDDERFIIASLHDISGEKRRVALERVFFHDLLNTAGGLLGMASMMADSADGGATEADTHRRQLLTLSSALVDEIQGQRALMAAEGGTLRLRLSTVSALEVVAAVQTVMGHHVVAAGRRIETQTVLGDPELTTDQTLLTRILVNLVKNALEATPVGGAVRIGVLPRRRDDAVEFTVTNPGEIPHDVALQIFRRSFSTKDPGRGLGTYSVKLFGETYLGGSVDFESRDGNTTFRFVCPVRSAPPQ